MKISINDAMADELGKAIYDDLMEVYGEMAVPCAKECVKLLKKTYKTIVDQYYAFETEDYIRHGESDVGTRAGNNLYLADDIHIQYKGRNGSHLRPDSIHIDIVGEHMLGSYPSWSKKKSMSRDAIVDYVFLSGSMHGLPRFSFTPNISIYGQKIEGNPLNIMLNARSMIVEREYTNKIINALNEHIKLYQRIIERW